MKQLESVEEECIICRWKPHLPMSGEAAVKDIMLLFLKSTRID